MRGQKNGAGRAPLDLPANAGSAHVVLRIMKRSKAIASSTWLPFFFAAPAHSAPAQTPAVQRQNRPETPAVARRDVICFAYYTVNQGVLKLTAQLCPLQDGETREATWRPRPGMTGKPSPLRVSQRTTTRIIATTRPGPRIFAWNDGMKVAPYRIAWRSVAWRHTRAASARIPLASAKSPGRVHRQLEPGPTAQARSHRQPQGPGSRPAVLLRRPGV
jgi:hypothetical protein